MRLHYAQRVGSFVIESSPMFQRRAATAIHHVKKDVGFYALRERAQGVILH
jgi:hypothetical protein